METKQAIEDRHSVRVFTNKDVEVNKLKGLKLHHGLIVSPGKFTL